MNILDLTTDATLIIFTFLEPDDLLHVGSTCQCWRELANDLLLWKNKCRLASITCSSDEAESSSQNSPVVQNRWKAAFLQVDKNWTSGLAAKRILMNESNDSFISCCYNGGRIATGSNEGIVKVWCAKTGRCLQTLVGHRHSVITCVMSPHNVISSAGRKLLIWDVNTGRLLKVLRGHTHSICCMAIYNNVVVSGARDATLRMWSIPDGVRMQVLIGHVGIVCHVQYNGRLVVSGSYDLSVKIWNSETGICLHTLVGHTDRISSLLFDGVHVVSGSRDSTIRVWNVESGRIKHVLSGHRLVTLDMKLKSNILVSGNSDTTAKVWDISTGQCLHTLTGPMKHTSFVSSVQISGRFIITSSNDGRVKLWNLRTGAFIRNIVELRTGGCAWWTSVTGNTLLVGFKSLAFSRRGKIMSLNFDANNE